MSRAVIFDMDGVLVDTARPHYESWVAVGRERGVEITWEQFHDTFGQPNHQIIPRLFGPGLSADEIRRIDERKEAAFRDIFRHSVAAAAGRGGTDPRPARGGLAPGRRLLGPAGEHRAGAGRARGGRLLRRRRLRAATWRGASPRRTCS